MRRALIALVLAVSALGCTKGNECDTCSDDSDCKKGLVCSQFNDEKKRCGTGDPTAPSTCRIR